MKKTNTIKPLTAADIRPIYVRPDGRIIYNKTARSYLDWWMRNRLILHAYAWHYRLMYARYVVLYWRRPLI